MNEIYQTDLASFLEFYESNHICPYYFCSKNELEDFIEAYLVKNLVQSDNDFLYFFRCMLKKLVGSLDSHTIIRTRDEYEHWPLKLEVAKSSEQVFVTAASEKYQKYIGREVVRINDAGIKDLLAESAQAISYSTDGWRKAETGRFLSSRPALRSLPSIKSDTNKITYYFMNNEKLEVDDGEYLQAKPKNFDFEINNDSLILHFTACSEEYPGQMRDAVQMLRKIVLGGMFKTFILDLSGNMGGNDQIIKPLVEWLKGVNLEKYVKVDRYVQSASLFALNDMCKIGARIIGKEIGSSMNHVGNNLRHELPSGRFLTIVATRYFYLDNHNDYHTVRTNKEFEELSPSYICPKSLLS